jgi:hypothetical protein
MGVSLNASYLPVARRAVDGHHGPLVPRAEVPLAEAVRARQAVVGWRSGVQPERVLLHVRHLSQGGETGRFSTSRPAALLLPPKLSSHTAV